MHRPMAVITISYSYLRSRLMDGSTGCRATGGGPCVCEALLLLSVNFSVGSGVTARVARWLLALQRAYNNN